MKVQDPVLYIGGILVKPPSEMTVSKNKLWKQGSGRSRTGNMCGSIQCRKYKLEITWTNLSEDEAMQLSNLLDPDFITVKFIDPKTKSFKTCTMYGGDEVYTVQNYCIDEAVYKGLPISLVEK